MPDFDFPNSPTTNQVYTANGVSWRWNGCLLYTSDAADEEDSGETEFLYQKKKIKPKAGRVLIFPGSFTHLHRGNPPYETKYIATGWLASNDQSNIFL